MSTTIPRIAEVSPTPTRLDTTRLSTAFGVAYAVGQVLTLVAMTILVLPHGGSPSDPALERGHGVQDAADVYRIGNFVFMISGMLLLGFLGAVATRLRRVDASGTLTTVGVAAGTLLALIWPMAGMLHDVALETAGAGADLRILAGWDSVAPYALAFSVLPRIFFVGAIVLALRAEGGSRWLVRSGVVILVLSLLGNATTVTAAAFPALALSSLGYELWVGAVAWRWLRRPAA